IRTAMNYSNDGDTDGTACGLMYELSRNYTLSNTADISPVFNIAYRHTEVDGYSESGTDAALNVGKQSLDTVTVGLGARYAAVVGQQMLNRDCGFEARALVKYDFGDTQTDTTVGFINHATRANIESAEMGAFGVELGAGISVPVGSGSIFTDGAMELRSDYTNFNATVGYKIQF
ncbi:MAG: autotransporter outer membrane beta-barrel domain-containing protein, partial [Akkermansia sp.]|nr:autotransporter outer membrane beta-barrel domain-containing protein [Akkermansia sp.]